MGFVGGMNGVCRELEIRFEKNTFRKNIEKIKTEMFYMGGAAYHGGMGGAEA